MAVSGNGSLKRSKPNYIYSIVGVAIVLFIMGIMGWFFLNLHAIGDNFKEDIRISVYLRTSDKNTVGKIQSFIAAAPYAKNVEYVDKEKAKAIWNKENNEDWSKILDVNPLPESIDFFAKADYVNPDSLSKISASIATAFKDDVADIQYPKSLVTNLNERATKVGLIFLVMSIILCAIVIISIDNTIRLAMFSRRFTIKTQQLFGATRWFIIKPFLGRGIWNGLISGIAACILIAVLLFYIDHTMPDLGLQGDLITFGALFGVVILFGILISFLSTLIAVLHYLRSKVEDLY